MKRSKNNMTEIYQPTRADKLRFKNNPNQFKVSGDKVFATLQGEGLTSGKQAVFFRLTLCNLACGSDGGWKCDTGYTWDRTRPEFWQEAESWTYDYAASQIKSAWREKFTNKDSKRLVIAGGEPLIQQSKIAKLLEKIPEWAIEIETNGTIMPISELSRCQFNCSPKLESSGNNKEKRYKPEVLRYINGLLNSQFKFVAVNSSDLDEVDNIAVECNLNPEKILIMPEGQTIEKVNHHASLISSDVARRGWQVAMRNQLIWFGPKRRT